MVAWAWAWAGGHTFLSGVSAAAAEKDLAAWPSTPVTWRYLPNIMVVGVRRGSSLVPVQN